MGNVELFQYAGADQYNLRSSKQKSLTIAMKEFRTHFATAGGFSKYTPSKSGVAFYHALVDMALLDDGDITIGPDYENSEPSIKSTISFFIGMIGARIVAEKEYGVKHLFHLKDSRIAFASTGKTPDFFGLGKVGKLSSLPMLIEAKGTASKRIDNTTIHKAKEQVKSITEVITTTGGVSTTYAKQELSGHVVGSCFNQGRLEFHDIDPMPDVEGILKVDLDKAIILYYQHVMSSLLFDGFRNLRESNESNRDAAVTKRIGEYTFGLPGKLFTELLKYEDVYEKIYQDTPKSKLSESRPEYVAQDDLAIQSLEDYTNNIFKKNLNVENAYNRIDRLLEELPRSEKVNCGLDGVIFVNSDD